MKQYGNQRGERERPESPFILVRSASGPHKRARYFLQSIAEGLLGFLVLWGVLSALRLPGALDPLGPSTRVLVDQLSLHALGVATLLGGAFVAFCIAGDYVAEYARVHGGGYLYLIFVVVYVFIVAFLLFHFVLRII